MVLRVVLLGVLEGASAVWTLVEDTVLVLSEREVDWLVRVVEPGAAHVALHVVARHVYGALCGSQTVHDHGVHVCPMVAALQTRQVFATLSPSSQLVVGGHHAGCSEAWRVNVEVWCCRHLRWLACCGRGGCGVAR